MANKLGEKHVCNNCGTKYYDFGKSEAKCPRCGTLPGDDEPEVLKATRAKRKVEVKAAFEDTDDEEDFTPSDDDTEVSVSDADLEDDDDDGDGDDLDDLEDDM